MRSFAVFTLLAAVITTSLANPASSLTKRAAEYSNNCKGSGLCSNTIRSDCEKAIATVNPSSSYSDQAQFSVGHCYMIYATNGAGAQEVSGQTIIDTANTILENCSGVCGSYGTNNVGCSSCHVTLNYRSA
ncbi:hypothetical protein BN946_scf184496.g3 [Trametes cinnabarina]|uniref:Distantly related to plant expansins n=1 Tax=Pycnoporus cinnabarinus TaxID=5643 RepID=A0A060SDV6_PYCCI|nr:hypothetical protein BN946_scf184496.g3 [Trametes cinnabarina]